MPLLRWRVTRQMLQVLYSVAVCMRGHNSRASSNEEGGIDLQCYNRLIPQNMTKKNTSEIDDDVTAKPPMST